ncbi:MAG TPA: hypothetical protein PKI93_03585 [Alphaproteobacteria bacterium]|nr:hypothetical protein [Alphaproteobacteria bacterium]
MIGPHEGKELELMLASKKHLAIFHDIAPKNGTIAEKIIPDRAFAPHVQAGQIIRRQKEFIHPRTGVIGKLLGYSEGDIAGFIYKDKAA